MSIEISGNASNAATQTAQKPQGKELTTVTINCKNKKCEEQRAHTPSCSHTVSTKPAPKAGEDGYLLDKTV